jgi:DNA-directed RNA polymerase subunit M/transcription elongation factor TFIIS
MIRFACPTCNAVFTVADEKGGKAGKCPKCQAQFVIPEAEEGSSPLPPPPPAAPPPIPASSDIEIEPCPGCQAKLTVEAGDLGKEVECPYCKTTYAAKDPNAKPKKSLSKRPRDDDEDDDDRPRRKRDRFGEDRDDDDDIDDNRPRRRRQSRRDNLPDGQSGAMTALICGILSLTFCGCFTGIPAVIVGYQNLNTKNRGMAMAGMICGIVNLVITLLAFIFYIFVFAVAGLGAAGRR